MNALSHPRLVREVLALARAVFGWWVDLAFDVRSSGRTDRKGRMLFDVRVAILSAGPCTSILMKTAWWNSLRLYPAPSRPARPPRERALHSMRRLLWAQLDDGHSGQALTREGAREAEFRHWLKKKARVSDD